MKFSMRKTAIAMALCSMCVGGTALAQVETLLDKTITADENVTLNNTVNLTIDKTYDVNQELNFIFTAANADLDHAAVALIDNKQINAGNDIGQLDTTNTSVVQNGVTGDTGNVQLNVSAGTNNQQDNAAVFATAAADQTIKAPSNGAANAEAIVFQSASGNSTTIDGDPAVNTAGFQDAVNDSTGSIQINTSAGVNHQQKNALAIAFADSALMAEASAVAFQETTENCTTNNTPVINNLVFGNALVNMSGNTQLNATVGMGNQQANSLVIASSTP